MSLSLCNSALNADTSAPVDNGGMPIPVKVDDSGMVLPNAPVDDSGMGIPIKPVDDSGMLPICDKPGQVPTPVDDSGLVVQTLNPINDDGMIAICDKPGNINLSSSSNSNVMNVNGVYFRRDLKAFKIRQYEIISATYNGIDVSGQLQQYALQGKLPRFKRVMIEKIQNKQLSTKQSSMYSQGNRFALSLFFELDITGTKYLPQLQMQARVKLGDTKSMPAKPIYRIYNVTVTEKDVFSKQAVAPRIAEFTD